MFRADIVGLSRLGLLLKVTKEAQELYDLATSISRCEFLRQGSVQELVKFLLVPEDEQNSKRREGEEVISKS